MRSVRSPEVQSHGTAHTIFGSPLAAPGRADSLAARACAPCVLRSTTFHPLPWQIGQSARAISQAYAAPSSSARTQRCAKISVLWKPRWAPASIGFEELSFDANSVPRRRAHDRMARPALVGNAQVARHFSAEELRKRF